jgi:hypothetical protein
MPIPTLIASLIEMSPGSGCTLDLKRTCLFQIHLHEIDFTRERERTDVL